MSNFRVYNPNLCPDLWNEQYQLDPKVRINLLRIANDFYEKSKFPSPIIDIYLMGSISNFNWTPESDADVHVIIDYNKLQMPPETAIKSIKTASANWNLEHTILVKKHKVEMNFQNIHELKPHVTGIYSLMKDQWIRKPTQQNIRVDKVAIQSKFSGLKTYIQNAIKSQNVDTMKKAKEYVDSFRQYGLDHNGELSIENIVFKILRSKGLITALKNSITAIYDKQMSVDEITQQQLNRRLPPPENIRQNDDFSLKLNQLTLDNLKALKEKTLRTLKYLKTHPELESDVKTNEIYKEYLYYDNEIKRRLKYINDPVDEGYGMGDPSKDPKAVGRWTVKYDSSSKILKESPEMETLKKNKKPLSDQERELIMNADAVWNHGPNGEKTPAVWKAVIKNKTWFVTNTHRAYQAKPTLKAAIKAYHTFIKGTA